MGVTTHCKRFGARWLLRPLQPKPICGSMILSKRRCCQGWCDCNEVETAPHLSAHPGQCKGPRDSFRTFMHISSFLSKFLGVARWDEGLENVCEQVSEASYLKSCNVTFLVENKHKLEDCSADSARSKHWGGAMLSAFLFRNITGLLQSGVREKQENHSLPNKNLSPSGL